MQDHVLLKQMQFYALLSGLCQAMIASACATVKRDNRAHRA